MPRRRRRLIRPAHPRVRLLLPLRLNRRIGVRLLARSNRRRRNSPLRHAAKLRARRTPSRSHPAFAM
ncbi:hypothetical protein GCM10022626_12370 [[Pseudomonas] carboxydohydrogena]